MRYQFLRFPQGKIKAVTFSYDDGCSYDLRLAEILDKYGIKCTFNINSGLMGKSGKLSFEQIKSIIGDKHEIAVHGDFHRALGKQRAIEGIKDALNCRIKLETEFDRIVRGMAYPDTGITAFCNNATYSSICNYLKDLGIVYARSLGGDNDRFELPGDWYNWLPTAHHANPNLMNYIDKFIAEFDDNTYIASRSPKLFYLWGHSFEFERNNNWNLLEEICEKLGNKNDIWYATNIEIYDYVNAYNSLVYNAEGTVIYNPTLIDVWLEIDKQIYLVKSGETIKIPIL